MNRKIIESIKRKNKNIFLILTFIYVLLIGIGKVSDGVLNIFYYDATGHALFADIGSVGIALVTTIAALITVIKNSKKGIWLVIALLILEIMIDLPNYLLVNGMIIPLCFFGYLHIKRAEITVVRLSRKNRVISEIQKFNPYFLYAAAMMAILWIAVFSYNIGRTGMNEKNDPSGFPGFPWWLVFLLLALAVLLFLSARVNRKGFAFLAVLIIVGGFIIASVTSGGTDPADLILQVLVIILIPPVLVPVIGLLRRKTG